MAVNPSLPQFGAPVLPRIGGPLAEFSMQLAVSPLVLVVLTMLVGIFVAAMTVMLVYHWRRFPFEHDVFRRAERIYMVGVVLLLAVAVVGIFLTA
ncbi:MAG: hypothetical protein AAB375_02945 [Patescibacteria group bacterium]